MNKPKKRTKALKNTANKSGLFRALVFGFFSCLAVWLLLAVVFSVIMSKQIDGTSLSGILSPVTVIVSLVVGGFAAGKTDKSCSVLSSFLLGCAVLGICYAISASLNLSRHLSSIMKTFLIVIILVCPMIGARFSTREKKRKMPDRKRL